jgi:hypothetical protein
MAAKEGKIRSMQGQWWLLKVIYGKTLHKNRSGNMPKTPPVIIPLSDGVHTIAGKSGSTVFYFFHPLKQILWEQFKRESLVDSQGK